jgi:acyl-CoA thioesterase-1
MGIGMARKIGQGLGKKLVALLAGCLVLLAAARAENVAAPATALPLSPPCAAPDVEIAAPAALPHVAALLEKRGTLRILAIGSSSTAGLGASSGGMSYPSRLEPILEQALKGIDIQIINRGVTGEVAEITADRIRSEVAIDKPDLVLWQLGTNDALTRVPPDEFETEVRDLLRWLKANNIDVVLVGMQYTTRLARDPSYAAIRESLHRIATEEKVLYVRRYDAMRFIALARANLQLMARDNFHLNDLGYQCMAEHVAHAVIASLYVKKPQPGRE